MESTNFMDRLIVKNMWKSYKFIQAKKYLFNPKQFEPNVVNN